MILFNNTNNNVFDSKNRLFRLHECLSENKNDDIIHLLN